MKILKITLLAWAIFGLGCQESTTPPTTDQRPVTEAESSEPSPPETAVPPSSEVEQPAPKEPKNEVTPKPPTTALVEGTPEKTTAKSPRIEFDQSAFDFGTIVSGDEVNYEFHFRNTGNADLVIHRATATCGCTQPSYPFVPIAPGEAGVIKVKFNSTGKIGTQRPTITVVSNASPRTKMLYLNGVVVDKLDTPLEENTTKGGDKNL